MATMPLTRKQQKTLAEIKAISSLAGTDHWNIEEYPAHARTVQLEIMKNHLVRGRIIMQYTLIDDLLSCNITNQYFEIKKGEQTYKRLWRTKSFRAFSYHALDSLHLLNKLRLVHELRPVAKKVRDIIDRVNALRNALAHSFYPHNRFQYRHSKKVTYRDYDVFTLAGFTYVEMECQQAVEYLFKRAFGVKPQSLTAIE
jgi:hypothetical protein